MTPNSPRTSHHQAPPSPRMPQAQAQVCDVMNELQMKMQRASALREQTKHKASLVQDQSEQQSSTMEQQVAQQRSQMLQEQSKQQIASMLQEKALQQKEQFLREQLRQHQQRASMLPDESQGVSLARVHSTRDLSIQQSPSVQHKNSVQNPGLIPTSPKIVISQPGNPATGKNTTDLENMFTVKKLPFLNDINRLRQPEIHSSVSTLTAPTHSDSDR